MELLEERLVTTFVARESHPLEVKSLPDFSNEKQLIVQYGRPTYAILQNISTAFGFSTHLAAIRQFSKKSFAETLVAKTSIQTRGTKPPTATSRSPADGGLQIETSPEAYLQLRASNTLFQLET